MTTTSAILWQKMFTSVWLEGHYEGSAQCVRIEKRGNGCCGAPGGVLVGNVQGLSGRACGTHSNERTAAVFGTDWHRCVTAYALVGTLWHRCVIDFAPDRLQTGFGCADAKSMPRVAPDT